MFIKILVKRECRSTCDYLLQLIIVLSYKKLCHCFQSNGENYTSPAHIILWFLSDDPNDVDQGCALIDARLYRLSISLYFLTTRTLQNLLKKKGFSGTSTSSSRTSVHILHTEALKWPTDNGKNYWLNLIPIFFLYVSLRQRYLCPIH